MAKTFGCGFEYTMFMDTYKLPTKKNLLLAKQRLALARKGYDLLDKKRHVLIRELATVEAQAGQLLRELYDALHIAYAALLVTHAEMGTKRVEKVSNDMHAGVAVRIHFHGIMGVEVPQISMCDDDIKPVIPYALSETTVSLDEAVLAWTKARELIISHAAIENTMYRLNLHIKKTQKRANALGNITIPMYEARIKYIQERLEERERDELARLKLVKS